MESAMQVALTGLGFVAFTPRTTFETGILGSKARFKTFLRLGPVPLADGITVSRQRQITIIL
ncbi:hypothetical protein [Lactiplantibacillus fabifermentans]|nr:hypothetical protein [Lactiplantibacillus fabifermentans]KRO28335.1 hypothetical protein DY78_GL002465 [Lactiplantibacillus fabifermentans DSM 21115]